MQKQKFKAGLVLPLFNNVTKLSLTQIEIPEEWDELFDRKKKEQFIKKLQKQFVKTGCYVPLMVFQYDDKYIIVDGVLRFLALQDLNLNQIDCIIIEKTPNSKDQVKDLIIEFNLKSVPTIAERIRLLSHYLRVVECDEEDETSCNEKYGFISEQYGRGWGRNNVITVKRALVFDKENPVNPLNLSERLLENQMSFDRAKKCLDLLADPKNNYDLSKEIDAKILQGFTNNNYDLKKTESLIRQYNTKVDKGTSAITVLNDISSDRYLIIPGNSLDTQFPEGTKINGIFTSIPYFNLIEYGKDEISRENKEVGCDLEIGREKKREDFVENIVDVMKIGADHMTKDGVIIINLHDTYKGSICVGVVALLILEMQKAGFFFIDQIIWQKSNSKPQSNEISRFTNSYESILIFSKSPDYYYDQLRIYDPEKSATVKSGCSEQGNKGLGKKKSYHISNPYKTMRNFLCDNDIEQILKLNISKERSQQDGLQNGFFGSFPTLLPIPFILSFFPENGTVWDPFGGTGTTGRAALMLNRKVIISELYEKNVAKISEILEKGISEFDANEYSTLKKDFLSLGDYSNLAA